MNKLKTWEGDEEQIQARANEFLSYAEAFVVYDDNDAKTADDRIVEGKNIMKAATLIFKDPIQKAHEAHKALIKAKNIHYKPADEGTKILASKLSAYQHQRRLEIAEKQRLLDEKAKAEHEAECEAEAKRAEADGQKEVATALREMKHVPVEAPQVVERELMTKTKFRTDWEITSVLKSKVPLEYMIVDTAKALKMIRLNKGAVTIPGIEFKEIQVAVRRGE